MTVPVRITMMAVALMFVASGSRPRADSKWGEWSTPVNLGETINSAGIEAGPTITRRGLSLYFHSNRPGGFGQTDLYVARRASRHAPWQAPQNLGAVVNSGGFDNVPALPRDGHWLFFHSDRAGGFGSFDLYASYRANTRDDFAWQTPVNLGPNINTAASEAGAAYFIPPREDDDADEDHDHNHDRDDDEHCGRVPLLFFNSDRPGGAGNLDIYVSQRMSNGQFTPPSLLSELNSTASDQRSALTLDGLELFLSSDRPGSAGALDLWVSTRETLSQVWSTPVNLGPTVNTPFLDQQGSISARGDTLFFASNRPGGFGVQDLYVTTRERLKHHRSQ